jgi:ArsR family metal-binding transcriptional regulator
MKKMYIDEIKIIETTPCLADENLFKAITEMNTSVAGLLPYLNAVIEKPDYRSGSNSLTFKKGIVGFILKDNNINITRFANMTELYELLDWVRELINDTYEKRSGIEPSYKERKVVPVIKLYSFLPKKNCKKCGLNTCMAFAARLSKSEAEIDDCPLMLEIEFSELKQKLESEMAE